MLTRRCRLGCDQCHKSLGEGTYVDVNNRHFCSEECQTKFHARPQRTIITEPIDFQGIKKDGVLCMNYPVQAEHAWVTTIHGKPWVAC